MVVQKTWLALCGGLLLGVAGCGEDAGVTDRPATVPVSGVVTMGGNPVEGATVTFHAGVPAPGQPAQGNSAVGQTDAEGRFQLKTFEGNDGAVPGEYVVTISKYEAAAAGGGNSSNPAEEPADYKPPTAEELAASAPKSLLPEKYASAKTSDQKANVKAEGENEFTFALEQ